MIDKVSDIQVDSKAKRRIKECKNTFIDFWGKEQSTKYTKFSGKARRHYIKTIKGISEDDVNSKIDRFRIETMKYMHEIVKEFSRFYNKELGNA